MKRIVFALLAALPFAAQAFAQSTCTPTLEGR